MQVVLWGVFAATIGLAGLVVRQRRLSGSVELSNPLGVPLAGGIQVTARLPKGWQVALDAAQHARGASALMPTGPVELFQAQEPAGGVGTPDPDAELGDVGRRLWIRCQVMSGPGGSAEAYLDESGLLADTVTLVGTPRGRAGPPDGILPVAGVNGRWLAVQRRVPSAPGLAGPAYKPEYLAVGIVPLGPDTSVAVSVVLLCPNLGPDPSGDQDLLRRVASAVTVQRDPIQGGTDNRRRP